MSKPEQPASPPPPPPPTGGYAPPPAGGYAPPPGGYAPPPAGYGPPPGGYPAAGGTYGPPPNGYATNDEKTWALIAHFGGAVGALVSGGVLGFVGPLIAYVAKGTQSPTVRAHAVPALNFQILWSIIALVLLFPSFCSFFIPNFLVMIFQIVIGVIAGVKAAEGVVYRYPGAPGFIK